jgi:predicted nuclease of predicted toxin-antitoxin system
VSVKLLLDENLSQRLLQPLSDLFPGSMHIRDLAGSGASDNVVWQTAGVGDFILTTRDEDFIGISVLRGSPPKVVWLNVGNSRIATIAALLRSHAADIERFDADTDYTFLAIGYYSAATSRAAQ